MNNPKHLDLVKTRAYNEVGKGGLYEDIDIERTSIFLDQEFMRPNSNYEKIEDSLDYAPFENVL